MAPAQLKVIAALPEGWREDAQRVSSRFHLDPLDWYRGPAAADHLPAIARAVWGERCIVVRYESWRGVAERRLEPLQRFPAAVADAARRSAGETDARGWRDVTVPIESVEHAMRQLLRLGSQAEVLEPAALRRRMSETAGAMAALYAAASHAAG